MLHWGARCVSYLCCNHPLLVGVIRLLKVLLLLVVLLTINLLFVVLLRILLILPLLVVCDSLILLHTGMLRFEIKIQAFLRLCQFGSIGLLMDSTTCDQHWIL